MELEKEIKTRFENDYHKVIVNTIYTYGWVTNLLKKRLSKHHITMQQFNILRILRGQHPNPATINILKERMLDKMSDASRIVERLVQKGLVTRCINQKDRRAVDIIISDKGLDLLKQLDPVITPIDVLKGNLSEAEAKQLNFLLDKLRGVNELKS
ncbi:MAG: MarR family transcriptional regulator [Pyrinomonadaceae bacterium]|nr:MarR family transcriptional regulator [Sphingobacteriaceae bacterium]